jgi:hypothetical protein
LTPAQLEDMSLSSSGCAVEIDALMASGSKYLRSCMINVFGMRLL